MKFIKRIEEGEMWTAAFIGWKVLPLINYRTGGDSKMFRLGINLGFVLVKFDIIPL